MPFNLSRRTIHKTAWQVEVGDRVGSLDSSSEVTGVTRDGDRVRIDFADGTRHDLDANETVPVVATG
jgi:hypothetical protein